MLMARYWKLVDMIPPAIMPAVKSCPTVTPRAAAWPPKMDPSRTSRIDGRPKMNATAILSRKNDLTSPPPRAAASRQRAGSATAAAFGVAAAVAGAGGAASVLWGMTGLRDQFEGGVFQRRSGHGQARDLAAELPAQLGDELGR